jgi:type IV secretion system protein VirB4
MMLFLKKNIDETEALPAGAEATPLHEFIPYHSHYDAQTLITKNGELMQIIKIASNTRGLNYESGEGSGNTVRDIIRRAIDEVITTDRYAIWVHTLRKRKAVTQRSKHTQPLAAHLHSQWQKRHKWKSQYYNEIYVSILYEGQYSRLLDKDTLKHVFSPGRNRRYRRNYLEQAHHALDDTVTKLLQHIRQHYNAQRLGIVERNGLETNGQSIFFSEPAEFLHNLTSLRSMPQPVSHTDLSQQISPDALIVGFNALETKDSDGTKRFGAMLSLKQYHEIPPETADKLLQAPLELIISQSMRFIPAAKALKQYKEQKQMFDISGDAYSAKHTGLKDMIDAGKKRDVDYAEQQTSILVLADEYKQLDAEILATQEAFADFGLITIREDIKLEECFWSQLPGNFEFIRRKDPIPASRMAGFARLNRFPTGSELNNHWNEAVCLVPTTVGSPYFFNFHHQDNGHTLLLDFNSFGDAMGRVALNFLLTSSLKFGGRMVIFDRGESSRLMTQKLDGTYHRILPHSPRALSLNPFALEDSKRLVCGAFRALPRAHGRPKGNFTRFHRPDFCRAAGWPLPPCVFASRRKA